MMTRGGRGVKNAENLMTSYVNDDPIKAKSLRHFAPVRKQFCIKVTLILAEKSTENNAKQLQKNCKYRRKESENGFQIKSKETKEE